MSVPGPPAAAANGERCTHTCPQHCGFDGPVPQLYPLTLTLHCPKQHHGLVIEDLIVPSLKAQQGWVRFYSDQHGCGPLNIRVTAGARETLDRLLHREER